MRIENDHFVVFDLDDTLYCEFDFLLSAYEEIIVKTIGKFDKELYIELINQYIERKNPFQYLLKNHLRDQKLSIKDLLAIYRAHIPNIKLANHAKEFIQQLQLRKIPMGLVTDGRSVTQRNKLISLGIQNVFSGIIISEEFGSEKPAPENYQYFVDNFPGHKYIYIGDNISKDFVAPNKLNWTTIRVYNKNNFSIHVQNQEFPKEYYPQITISDFNELSFT